MTESSGLASRLTSLYGWVTRMTSLTPGKFSTLAGSFFASCPVTPIAVRCAPGIGCALRPRRSMCRTTASICSAEAAASITTSMRASIIDGLMRKSLITLGAALLLSTQAFATYYVVLKDGTQYRAKAKWTVVNGKAIVALENGQTLQLDPTAIDVGKSEEVTKFGGGSVLAQ